MLISQNRKQLVLNSALELGEDLTVEKKGKGRKFVSRFIEAGLAHYQEFGDILITKETLDKFIHTMVGCPLIINHKEITDKNADKERVGVISNVWFNDMDGWYYCDGIIWDLQAIDLVKNQGWSVSCTYDFVSDNQEKTHNGKQIAMEFIDGEFLHLALVNNPRYERANIVINSKDRAENEDKWITIHPNGEDSKGRPLLIKEGETPKEAIERVYKKEEKKEETKKAIDFSKYSTKELEQAQQTYATHLGSATQYGEEQYQAEKKMLDDITEELDKRKAEQTPKEGKKEEKKYNYTLTKKEVENKKALGGMADTGDYYTNGEFAIDKKYLNIKGQEPKKVEEINKTLKKMLGEGARKKQKEEKYEAIKEYENGILESEYNKKPIDVAKYSYNNVKYGFKEDVYINKKYNDLFKNFELKFAGPGQPVYAYKDGEIVGIIMPILSKETKFKKIENKAQNGKELTIMTVLKDLENFVKGIINNADDKEEKVENEDKRKIIDEVGGILKDKVDEEVWRTVIGKLEKIAYNPSETDKADNKCKNEDDEEEEKEEKFEEEKEIAENKEAKNEEKEDKEEDKKEDKTDNKCAKNSMDDVKRAIMGGNAKIKTASSYVSQADRLKAGEQY